ncbi:MAG TPA: pyridoxamine 5'-phosphate oxidase family protein [Azospirillaceae bacterium]|nr:pyridoxamine 5'-phosphate oxidase family protein [Azospirillaceae bacterium]
MSNGDDERVVTSIEQLERLYGRPAAPSLVKEIDRLHPAYRAYVEMAPLVMLATSGPGGLDVSPRGDAAPVVHVEDERTLLLPDRRGNNRIDSLRNIVADPRVALLFLLPGIGETLRVSGTAAIHTDPALLQRFAVDGRPPRTVLRIAIGSVFFQCSRALVRSRAWDAAAHVPRASVPTPGAVLAALSAEPFDGDAYDRALPGRVAETLY